MTAPTLDEIFFCDGCSEWRHITMREVGRKYCRICYAAHQARLNKGLKEGTFSESELVGGKISMELGRPILPDDHVSYTVPDDDPPLSTDDLNARLRKAEWEA